MLTPAIWEAVGGGKGFMCLGCVEGILGRPLRRSDFITAAVNIPGHPWNTPRLEAALARTGPRRPIRAVRRRWPRPTPAPFVLGDGCPAYDEHGVRCTAAASAHPDQHVNGHTSWPVRPIEAAQHRYAANMARAGLEVTITLLRPGQVQISGRQPATES
jgi:hypothetical protein